MSSTVTFDGRVAIVTGAGGGLGRSYARLLASRGAKVVVNDIQNAADVVAEIKAQDGEAAADEHDISTEDGARGLVETAVSAFGRIDAVVNNAGIAIRCPFTEMTWELFDRTMRVNTYGPYFITRHAWPHLIESGQGRVVLVASKTAIWGGSRALTHYGISKGAILAMARQLSLEGADHGICVNAMLPTAVTKGNQPRESHIAQQLGVDPSDGSALMERSTSLVAAVVAWLCHPDCTSNGEFFNATAGEANRLSFAMGTGINDLNLTIETVRDHFTTITDMTEASILPAIWGSDVKA